MNVRQTARAFFVMAVAGCLPLFVPSPARTQDNAPPAADAGYANGAYPGVTYYAYPSYPRWTFQYGPFHCTPYSYYRPLQPDDWGYGPHGPRHNLNASQKSPSGMTWW